MLHYLKCNYLGLNLNDYMALYYPSEMEVEKYSYSDITNNIEFIVLYSPLRYAKSRVRAWKTLVALEEKGYIFGFYINNYGSLNTLQRGVSDADNWTYWQGLKQGGGRYDEIDTGDVIVYFTPKGLKANTKMNDEYMWGGVDIKAFHVELLKNDNKLKQGATNSKLVDDLVRLVYADSDSNLRPVWGVGILNKERVFDEKTAVNYSLIEQSIKNKLKEKRGY